MGISWYLPPASCLPSIGAEEESGEGGHSEVVVNVISEALNAANFCFSQAEASSGFLLSLHCGDVSSPRETRLPHKAFLAQVP